MSAEGSPIAGLFLHAVRSDWGLAILSHELDGKRHYLFEDGQRRALATGFDAMMKRVETPTFEQHAAYAKLRKLVASRQKDGTPKWAGFEEQLGRLRQAYPEGLSGTKWEAELRSSSPEKLGREAVIELARANLSREQMDALASARHFEKVWSLVVSVLEKSGLVPAAQLRLPVRGDRMHDLAVAACNLLGDGALYAERFDRFVASVTAATGKSPSWELATAPAALLYPRDHVHVGLQHVRRQLKVIGSRRALPALPNGALYGFVLAQIRALVHKLNDHGEAPRDLLDVRDFMALTLAPPRARKDTRPT
jgi:hypothetical protein